MDNAVGLSQEYRKTTVGEPCPLLSMLLNKESKLRAVAPKTRPMFMLQTEDEVVCFSVTDCGL
jgi:hypothetical protein